MHKDFHSSNFEWGNTTMIWISFIEANASMVCINTGLPFNNKNCFGIEDSMRLPLPPATIMANFLSETVDDIIEISRGSFK